VNDTIRTLYAFNFVYCQSLFADIGAEEMLEQPSPAINPPAWLLGHLAICTDYALQMMAFDKQLPTEWHEEFGPRSQPLSQKHPYPSKQEMWDAYAAGHKAVESASREVSTETLQKPNPLPFKFLQENLPTTGDLLGHLMTTHEASHLGHLSNWRRQMGRKPLL